LIGERRNQINLIAIERSYDRPRQHEHADHGFVAEGRDAEKRPLALAHCVFRISLDIWNMDGLAA
jgi:hypothetical protein